MKTHTREEVDLLKMSAEHLLSLRQAAAPIAGEHRLRIASASLRFLLVEDNLLKAWKVSGIGGPIVVDAMDFASPPGPQSVGFSGGAEIMPGVPFSTGWGDDVHWEPKRFNLPDFLRAPCIYFKGMKVSRHVLIQFIANTKGGNHYDPAGRAQKSQSEKFELLRRLEQEGLAGLSLAVNNRNLIHHEVASIIVSLLRSKEIQRLTDLAQLMPYIGHIGPAGQQSRG